MATLGASSCRLVLEYTTLGQVKHAKLDRYLIRRSRWGNWGKWFTFMWGKRGTWQKSESDSARTALVFYMAVSSMQPKTVSYLHITGQQCRVEVIRADVPLLPAPLPSGPPWAFSGCRCPSCFPPYNPLSVQFRFSAVLGACKRCPHPWGPQHPWSCLGRPIKHLRLLSKRDSVC